MGHRVLSSCLAHAHLFSFYFYLIIFYFTLFYLLYFVLYFRLFRYLSIEFSSFPTQMKHWRRIELGMLDTPIYLHVVWASIVGASASELIVRWVINKPEHPIPELIRNAYGAWTRWLLLRISRWSLFIPVSNTTLIYWCVQSGTAKHRVFLRSAGRLFLGCLNSPKKNTTQNGVAHSTLQEVYETPFRWQYYPSSPGWPWRLNCFELFCRKA